MGPPASLCAGDLPWSSAFARSADHRYLNADQPLTSISLSPSQGSDRLRIKEPRITLSTPVFGCDCSDFSPRSRRLCPHRSLRNVKIAKNPATTLKGRREAFNGWSRTGALVNTRRPDADTNLARCGQTLATRTTSGMVVSPARTLSQPSSRMVRKPVSRAACRISLVVPWRITSSRTASVNCRSS